MPLHKGPVVYLSNLPYEATNDSVEAAFEDEHYVVEHIELIKKGTATRTKGTGLAAVTLQEGTDAAAAVKVRMGLGCGTSSSVRGRGGA